MEVKERLLNQIEEIDDEALLTEIDMIVSNLRRHNETPYPLDEAMLASLERAEEDIREGRVIEHQEAMKMMREWIHER